MCMILRSSVRVLLAVQEFRRSDDMVNVGIHNRIGS
jgi:hypothetical protein